MKLFCNAVFEGGGVKGIGLVGAAEEIVNAGYVFINLAGSSAGAIVAALLAVGYTPKEIKKEMLATDFTKFKSKPIASRFGLIGDIINVNSNLGLYNANYFEKWLHDLLVKKGKTSFGDLKNHYVSKNMPAYKLQVTATDVTKKRLLVLPGDLKEFDIDPDSFSIAKAVRMSMSIPVFYEPYKLYNNNEQAHYIVDGGLISNYPVWIIDDGESRYEYPTFGFKFISNNEHQQVFDRNIISYSKAIIGLAMDSNEIEYGHNASGDKERTIEIPTAVSIDGKKEQINTIDFGISNEASLALYVNGKVAAKKFLRNWNFKNWQSQFRPFK